MKSLVICLVAVLLHTACGLQSMTGSVDSANLASNRRQEIRFPLTCEGELGKITFAKVANGIDVKGVPTDGKWEPSFKKCTKETFQGRDYITCRPVQDEILRNYVRFIKVEFGGDKLAAYAIDVMGDDNDKFPMRWETCI